LAHHHLYSSQFQWFQSFNRFAHKKRIPFQTFQSFNRYASFKRYQASAGSKRFQRVEQALENGCAPRDDRWSEAIAVGSLPFVERVKNDLGVKAMHRCAMGA
jgi:hypothetical protein